MIVALHRYAQFVLNNVATPDTIHLLLADQGRCVASHYCHHLDVNDDRDPGDPIAHHRVASSPYFSLIFARALVFSR